MLTAVVPVKVRLVVFDLYLCWAVLFVLLVVVVEFIVFVVVLLSSTTSTPTNTTKTTTSITRFIATFTTQCTLNYGTSGFGCDSGIGLVVSVMVVVMVNYWW